MFPAPEFIDTNGIRMAVYEQGTGPAVILVHGFPELAFSWRHQLPALAGAGFRAIAPDMRGYGQTDKPDGIEAYRASELIADLTGLLDSLGLERATFVGHDWGALLLWQMAMLEPARIENLIALNIPHTPRPSIDPIQLMRQRLGDDFYIVNFQDSNVADKVFAADPAHFFTMLMRRDQITRTQFEQLTADKKALSLLKTMQRTEAGGEPLLEEDELAYYVDAFRASGFTPAINWYRNWRSLEGVDQHISIPTLFIGAADDVVISPQQIEAMRPLVADLTIEILQPCGHWSQQERPGDVNHLIVDWLAKIR